MAIRGDIKSEMPHEQVLWVEISGWPSGVASRLRKRIGALGRHGAFHRKVGITNDPVRRWSQAYRRHGWQRMRVLYRSTRHEHVCELERLLVEHLDVSLSEGWYYNATGGGGGKKPNLGPFYVYLVTAPKFAHID